MSFFKVSGLRTLSTVSESFRLDTESECTSASDFVDFVPRSRTGSVFGYRSSAGLENVDNFWTGYGPMRSTTELTEDSIPQIAAFSTVAGHVQPLSRTVSGLARENSVNDLNLEQLDVLDQEVESGRGVGYPKDLSDTSTASEQPAVKRIKNVNTIESLVDIDVPRLHLGDVGRSKLKSLISLATKDNSTLRDRVAEIGKVKLASIPQLLQMAHLCGLWDEAVAISQSFSAKR